MKSAVTVSLVPEARGGPFVFWDDLGAACRKAGELGFDAIEVFPPGADALNVPEARSLVESNGLRVAAIGTGAGWVRHKLSLSAANPETRAKARAFIRLMIDVAGELQSRVIIGSMQGRWEGEVSRDMAVGYLAEALEELGEHGAHRGVTVLYEHLNRYETNLFNRIDDVVPFLAGLRTRNVKILADLFHMNIEEGSLADAMHAAGKYLGHVHLADSNRRAAGLGHTHFQPVIAALRAMNYKGYLSAECLPYPDSEAAAEQTIRAFRQLTA